MKKIALLIVLSFSFFTSNAQIVNEGVLKIESGTSVYFADDYTNKVGATHTNDGDLHLVGVLQMMVLQQFPRQELLILMA